MREEPDLRLVYRPPFQSYLVPWASRCFRNSLDFQERVLGWTPTQPVTVFLADFSDFGNASAGAVPRNMLSLQISPISFAYETVTPNERLAWLFNHELVHIATVDQPTRGDRRWRAFFGGKVLPNEDDPETILYYWLTAPRDASPRWYHEGMAVFFETWMSGGQGRAQGAYDEMAFRTMVAEGARFHDPLSLVSEGTHSDFQNEVNSYLYGTRFVSYLASRYSPEDVVRWIGRPQGSAAYYAHRFRQVFGVRLDDAWGDWIAAEKEFQGANLEKLRAYPLTPYHDLTPHGLGSVSRAFWDPVARKVYVATHRPGVVANVASIDVDRGTIEPLAEVKLPILFTVTSLAWDPGDRTLFYTTDNFEYRDVVRLDPETGKKEILLKDARIGDLAFDRADGSLWGIRHFNGIATVVRIPRPWTTWEQVRSWPYGEVPYDLDVSPDGERVSMSVGGIDGRHRLEVYRAEDLRSAEPRPILAKEFGSAIPTGFVFSDDGAYLWGSSYYTGVANVWRLELATEKLDAMTNAETGFFRPVPRDDGTAIVFRYASDGFVPAVVEPKPLDDLGTIAFFGAEIAKAHPVVRDWVLGSPARLPFDESAPTKPYSIERGLRLESAYPIVEGYKDSAAIGWRLDWSDPLLLGHLSSTVSWSPDRDLPSSERSHASIAYRRYDWRAHASWNDADFYDLFGPTKRSRKGWDAGLGWSRTLLYDDPRKLELALDLDVRGKLDTLPDYQNVAVAIDRLQSFSGSLTYRNLRRSLGGVDDEKGVRAEAAMWADRAAGDVTPRLLLQWDGGLPAGPPHASLWLRAAAGRGFGDLEDPFASFYFGAFGNNRVDRGSIKRYRDPESFPGLDINEVPARTFGKATVEWNLPPLLFRRAGSPGFYPAWARASIFVSGLTTDFDRDPVRRTIGSAGVQADLRIQYLSRLQGTLSVGWGVAFEKGVGPRDEWMISLKILP